MECNKKIVVQNYYHLMTPWLVGLNMVCRYDLTGIAA